MTRPLLRICAAAALGLLILPGCRRAVQPADVPRIATTTSYLEAAASDLLGGALSIVRLAEPGTCPGHFDMRPSQIAALRQCRALFRFDFQKGLDARFQGADAPLRVTAVSVPRGMGRPDSYLLACRQMADALSALELVSRTEAETRLREIADRLDALSCDATNRVRGAGLSGVAVIASGRQRDFCEWLGLDVVATFSAADAASIGEIEQAIAAGKLASIKLVIANLPEGRRTADALAGRLGAGVVVFENFPLVRNGRVSFDAMLEANVEALARTALP
ncbi:MAG TPA: zinc ABC transporter substrate-binding protein [Verrucomicrobiota bacterium]|nr:zinc ABC transporter substrate-binding protein [Verrucomicrobiota bacterium]